MEHIINALAEKQTFIDLVNNNKGANYNLVREELAKHPTRLAKLNNGQYLKAKDLHELTWGIIDAISGDDKADDWE
jgi:hypothetical protein